MEIEKIVKNFIEQDIHCNLDLKIQTFVLLTCFVATDSKELFQEKLMEAAQKYEKESLKEVIYQLTPYLGYGRIYPFLVLTEEILGQTKDAKTVTNETRYQKGLEVQGEIVGKEALAFMREKEKEEYKFIWDDLASYCFGDFYTRKYLTIQEREIITFTALASFRDVTPQLGSHVKANLQVGNKKETLIEIVKLLVPYLGFPRSLNVINVIKENTKEEGEKKTEEKKKGGAFGLGQENTAFAQYFIGKSYLNPLTDPNKTSLFLANVTFEPGCRNNWHIHHAKSGGGQILICVDGEGWYQEEGKEAQSLKPGDVVTISANVKHWHGAKKDSWFSHIAIEVPGEETSNEWCEPVRDEEYEKLG